MLGETVGRAYEILSARSLIHTGVEDWIGLFR